MPALLIIALLVSGIPMGSISVSCQRCCDEADVMAAAVETPPCCRLSPDAPPSPARPADNGPGVLKPASTGQFITLAMDSACPSPAVYAVPLLRPPLLILRI